MAYMCNGVQCNICNTISYIYYPDVSRVASNISFGYLPANNFTKFGKINIIGIFSHLWQGTCKIRIFGKLVTVYRTM